MRSKRSFGRKRRVARRKVRVRKTLRRKSRVKFANGFPAIKYVRMKYVQTFKIDLATYSTGGVYLFKAGDLFSPNYSGSGGHQPLGFDQWAGFYDHYDVMSSSVKYSVRVAQPQAAPTGQYLVYGRVSDNLSVSSQVDTVMEQPGIQKRNLMSGAGPGSNAVIRLNYRKSKRFSSNNDTRAQVGSSPAEQTYFVLGIQSMYTTTDSSIGDPATVYVTADITYMAKFDGLKYLAQS